MSRDDVARRLRRWAGNSWPLLAQTAAASTAWLIARNVIGNHDPFFAPISAVVALNAPLGERGRNTLRLLLGVFVGIIVGELAIKVIGGGYGTLALATFVAMIIARSLGGARIVIAQAAISAILIVTVADGQYGVNRLVDAAIGGAVALLFSQVIFSPEPVRLLRGAEAAALRGMAEGLGMTARAIEQDDEDLAVHAVSNLRDQRDRLAELGRLRRVGQGVARHSAIWRSQLAPVVRESEESGHLDLLSGSCLMLARVVEAADSTERRPLAGAVSEFSSVLSDLAEDLGERSTRQHAVDRTLEAVRKLNRDKAEDSLEREAILAARIVAADIMTFAGADPSEAVAAARAGTGNFDIPAPPSAPRLPFGLRRRRSR